MTDYQAAVTASLSLPPSEISRQSVIIGYSLSHCQPDPSLPVSCLRLVVLQYYYGELSTQATSHSDCAQCTLWSAVAKPGKSRSNSGSEADRLCHNCCSGPAFLLSQWWLQVLLRLNSSGWSLLVTASAGPEAQLPPTLEGRQAAAA
jgi:hypothetical protein